MDKTKDLNGSSSAENDAIAGSSNDDKYRIYASVAFMVVVLVIGLPMWWKTTEVYRVSLPYSDIHDLSESLIQINLTVGIFTHKPERSALLIEELNNAFKNSDLWNIQFDQIPQIEGADKIKTPAALEAMILKHYPVKTGDFIFIEWTNLQEDVLLTTDRSALIKPDTTSSKLQNVLNINILQTHRMRAILTEDEDERRTMTKNSPPQLQYDVIISVLNPRPDLMDVKWNVQLATKTYIQPFLDAVSEISNFTLKTQWKYQLPIDGNLKQIRDASKLGRHYALHDTSMPHIITSIEKNLGAGITDNSVINMVVYVPSCDIAPIHIYKDKDVKATRNKVDSFISPKWGGVIISNPPEEACRAYNENLEKVSFYINTNDVMQIMLYQLHKLLDIHVDVTLAGVKADDVDQISPRTWEYDAFIRRSVVNHIITSTHTLQSLIQLLDEISYIVINDDVGLAVNEAYEEILKAKLHLQNGDLLKASTHAKKAFASSEKAFFDASLLAQLYFPDEQKYAIYIPLFLPIMVPVVSSLSMLKKYYGASKAATKLKTN
ncbi:GPI transamidase component PIG-S-like isoform X1 [Episyrphus balteatus]|uniref:GPI transamidase component PIG-S-like isoform X1 n=1 Tax=Episyrphus balteatus TaxID=286459 RepID=UPI0024856D7F|nr:GPI transamidase component PIG-S-like isoform X1 [Episyrphus balteatus]